MKFVTAAICIALSSFLFVSGAFAGDFAKREIYGFSQDGTLFAFEEYGRQDGSGYSYSNLYVINTDTDQWTANSPYRVTFEDENKSVFEAREQAKILAGPVMKSFEGRGLIAGTNQPTELSGNNKEMRVNPRLAVPPITASFELRIEEFPVLPSNLCKAFGQSKGFRLIEIATEPEHLSRLVHEDANVPDSRGCPIDYSIADIVTYYPEEGSPRFAALILVQNQGFEGPDGRFLAITGRID